MTDPPDVHRREAAFVVMRVPERQLLAAMRRTSHAGCDPDRDDQAVLRRKSCQHSLIESAATTCRDGILPSFRFAPPGPSEVPPHQ
jgi:hypothetical protein